LARHVVDALGAAGIEASLNERQGLDHGAWVPLRHLYPAADVPVVLVSVPAALDSREAYELGLALSPLANEEILVIGSGSLTHNLYEFRAGSTDEAAYAREFSLWIRQRVLAGDRDGLIHALERAPHAQRAHPTTEHFQPLLVALGAASKHLPATVLDGGIRHGVLAMESYVFGRDLVLKAKEVIA
jgi:4,5-DOPA dioxygenase extradiol